MKKIALYRNDCVIISVAPRIARLGQTRKATRSSVRYPDRFSGRMTIASLSGTGSRCCPAWIASSSMRCIACSASRTRPRVISHRGLSGRLRRTKMITKARAMAYSPVEQGRILGNPVLRDIATRLDASPVQVALAWVLRLDNICAIPRSGRPEHVYENRAALAIHLDRDALAALDAEFPPPLHAQPLEVF